jgi:hypothetical protein
MRNAQWKGDGVAELVEATSAVCVCFDRHNGSRHSDRREESL